MSAKTDSFVPIDIASLIRQCDKFASRCIENGDVLPPASAFDSAKTEGAFLSFDLEIERKYGQIRHKVNQIVYDGASLPQSLENLFAVRCMALLASAQIRLSFGLHFDWARGDLFAQNASLAFYWALTHFWQYSGRGFRKAIWDEEISRLKLCHDTTLLTKFWTRGKVGDELRLEMAEMWEREARTKLEECEKAVAELKQRTLKKPIIKKPT